MTDDELKRKVAELCGYRRNPLSGMWDNDDSGIPRLTYRVMVVNWQIPDYPNDLNAMAAAEATLNEDQHEAFREHLWRAACESADADVLNDGPGFSSCRRNRHWISATARQRAEAFLKTMSPESV